MQRGVAAGLNFLVWGAGYVYRRERTVTGGLLLVGYLFIHWYWFVAIGIGPALSDGNTIIVFVGHLLLSTGLAYDVYTITEGT